MRLRTRLALAFLLLSVVPLTAITLYSYTSSIRAFRRAVEAQGAAMAAEMGRRMDVVTATVTDRFDRLSAAELGDWNARDRAVHDRWRQQVSAALGDAGHYVSRLQFVPSETPPPPPPPPRGRRSTRPNQRPAAPGAFPSRTLGQPAVRPAPAAPATPVPPTAPAAAPEATSSQTRTVAAGSAAAASAAAASPALVQKPAVPDVPHASTEVGKADPAKIVVDLIPPKGITPETQAALDKMKDVLAALPRMTDAAGWASSVQAAARNVEQSARAMERRIEAERRNLQAQHAEFQQWINQGRGVEFPVHGEGRVVGTMNVEVSLDRIVDAVLATRARDSSEIRFAVDTNNRVRVSNGSDSRTLETLPLFKRVRASKQAVQTVSDDNWVLVARRHPSGILFGIARPIAGALGEIRSATGRNLGLGMLVILVALAGIFPISSRMTRNLSVLHDGVREIAKGDLSVRVPVRSKDEIGSLSEAFNQMAQDLGAHQKLIAERERLRGELELCRQLQTEMLPKQPLRLGFAEIKGVSIPAREVGGDFFNYFLLPTTGEVAVLVGDVSGKGVGAALLMANVQATLRARLPLGGDLAVLADAIDREIDESTPQSVYLTLFMGILDGTHHALRYVNAGHNPQFVLRKDGGIDRLVSTGLPIAMFAGHGYKEASVTLADGDCLFFYTDGITEVENEKGEMFGSERLEALLVKHHEEGVDALLAGIEKEVLTFRGAADLFDDATMMVLRLGAGSRSASQDSAAG